LLPQQRSPLHPRDSVAGDYKRVAHRDRQRNVTDRDARAVTIAARQMRSSRLLLPRPTNRRPTMCRVSDSILLEVRGTLDIVGKLFPAFSHQYLKRSSTSGDVVTLRTVALREGAQQSAAYDRPPSYTMKLRRGRSRLNEAAGDEAIVASIVSLRYRRLASAGGSSQLAPSQVGTASGASAPSMRRPDSPRCPAAAPRECQPCPCRRRAFPGRARGAQPDASSR